jgi:hypothetical protein
MFEILYLYLPSYKKFFKKYMYYLLCIFKMHKREIFKENISTWLIKQKLKYLIFLNGIFFFFIVALGVGTL